MGDDRFTRGNDQQRDMYGRQGRDRDSGYGSQRDDDGYRSGEYGHQRYGQREQMNRGIDYGRGGSQYGQSGERGSFGGDRDYYGGDRDGYRASGSSDRDYGRSSYGQSGSYGRNDRDDHDQGRGGYGQNSYGQGSFGQNSYGDRHPNDRGASQNSYGRSYGQNSYGNRDDHRSRYGSDAKGSSQRDYGRQPQGYQYEERGFLARAGDEVRSWFGDDEAERRRDQDARLDERYNNDTDSDYGSWRRGQIDALDRDYHEYRQENRTKFSNEFGSWRTNRQGQRDSLDQVKEHAEVVGSDGSHVGTVDKVRGDRIILTKTDQDAGGHHHSIPSSWLSKVEDDKVTLSKTADEAKRAWRDEENRSAFGSQDRSSGNGYGQSGSTTGYGQSSALGTSSTTTTNGGTSGLTGTSSTTGTSGLTGSSSSSASSSATDGSDKTGLNKSFSGTY